MVKKYVKFGPLEYALDAILMMTIPCIAMQNAPTFGDVLKPGKAQDVFFNICKGKTWPWDSLTYVYSLKACAIRMTGMLLYHSIL